MGLVHWVVAGLGWELGKEAAKEGIAAVKKSGEPEVPLTPKEEKRRAKEAKARDKARLKAEKLAAKAKIKAEKDRARAKQQADAAIDDELAALKKDVEQGR